MATQIRKSAVSIPTKIAEGYGRREYVDFLKIAQGAINELETCLILSIQVGLCTPSDIEELINLLREESQMIVALIKKLDE